MDFPALAELELMHNTVCKAVTDPRRILILYTLHEQPRHVTAIAESLDMPQPTVSRHLSILRQASLVDTERDGTSVIYRLVEPRVIAVLDNMRMVLRESLARQSTTVE
jgi:ArsR family transcriptional regulator